MGGGLENVGGSKSRRARGGGGESTRGVTREHLRSQHLARGACRSATGRLIEPPKSSWKGLDRVRDPREGAWTFQRARRRSPRPPSRVPTFPGAPVGYFSESDTAAVFYKEKRASSEGGRHAPWTHLRGEDLDERSALIHREHPACPTPRCRPGRPPRLQGAARLNLRGSRNDAKCRTQQKKNSLWIRGFAKPRRPETEGSLSRPGEKRSAVRMSSRKFFDL